MIPPPVRSGRRRWRSALRLARTGALSGICAWLVLTYGVQVFRIQGASMDPALESGERVLVDKIAVRFGALDRGDVLVFRDPGGSGAILVKRVAGLPGDTVRFHEDEVLVLAPTGANLQPCPGASGGGASVLADRPESVEIALDAGEYFVVGDNRVRSSDSRHWGPLPEELILGKARWRVYPPERMGRIDPAVALARELCGEDPEPPGGTGR